MTGVHDAIPEVQLRNVEDRDLEVFFDHQADPQAVEMAAFPARDRDQFTAHWAKIRADDTLVVRTIVADGMVAGNIGSWPQDGQQFLGYWRVGGDNLNGWPNQPSSSRFAGTLHEFTLWQYPLPASAVTGLRSLVH